MLHMERRTAVGLLLSGVMVFSVANDIIRFLFSYDIHYLSLFHWTARRGHYFVIQSSKIPAARPCQLADSLDMVSCVMSQILHGNYVNGHNMC